MRAGTQTPASSSAKGTTNPGPPVAKLSSARARARPGPAAAETCELVQLIRPDSEREAAASRQPASAMTAPGAVTPSVRSRR
jgi:hypothetical protein